MKNAKYTHIKKMERLEIAVLLGKGYSYRSIAKALGRSASSVSEEINNNSVKGIYDARKANHKAYVKRKYSKYQGMKVVRDLDLWNYVVKNLREDWSPELISGRIRKKIDAHLKYISPKGVYKFAYSVYGKLLLLEKHLAYKSKKRKSKATGKIPQIKDRIFIDKRPEIVNKRRRFGDFEGDFIVSGKNGKGVLLTLYERKGRYALIRKLTSKNINEVHKTIYELSSGIAINSLTLDNDIAFKKHKELSKLLEKPIYFCRPYHSWEKGGVENMNKLIRRYIPKNGDISQYTDEYIRMIQDKLNNRPRKCLGYKTPNEVMAKNKQFKKKTQHPLNDILKVEQTKKAECSA